MGALISGFLFHCISRQVCLIVYMALMAATIYGFSFAQSLFMLNALAVINGITSGGCDTASNVMTLELWGAKCGPFIQALHFCFALGTSMAPQILAPFLPATHPANITTLNETATNETVTDSSEEIVTVTNLIIPFGIGTVIIAASCIAFLISHFVIPFKSIAVASRAISSPNADTSGEASAMSILSAINWLGDSQNRQVIKLIGFSCLIITIYSGMEIIYFEFLPTFLQKIDNPFTARDASYVSSAMGYSFTCGKVLGITMAVWFRAHIIIYLNLIVLAVATIVMLTLSNLSHEAAWIGNVLMGLGFSSVFVSIYAFIEEQLKVTNTISALFVFSAGLTAMVYPPIVGNYIETHPLFLIWLTRVSVGITLIMFTVLYAMVRRRRRSRNEVQCNIPL
jgi:FHS family Na+ dependent glucose MFS transporter 1